MFNIQTKMYLICPMPEGVGLFVFKFVQQVIQISLFLIQRQWKSSRRTPTDLSEPWIRVFDHAQALFL